MYEERGAGLVIQMFFFFHPKNPVSLVGAKKITPLISRWCLERSAAIRSYTQVSKQAHLSKRKGLQNEPLLRGQKTHLQGGPKKPVSLVG